MAASPLVPITHAQISKIWQSRLMVGLIAELQASGFSPECGHHPLPSGHCCFIRLSAKEYPRLELRLERENLLEMPGYVDGYMATLQLEVTARSGPVLIDINRIGLDASGVFGMLEELHPAYTLKYAKQFLNG